MQNIYIYIYIYIYKVRSGTEQYGQQRTITIHCNG